MDVRMHYDDAAWELSDDIADDWVKRILDPIIFNDIGQVLVKHHQAGDAVVLAPLQTGAFNIALRMTFNRSSAAIIRFPLPGAIMFPEEKLRNEVATMRFIADQTAIPVPFIIHSGPRTESPSHLGPFVIMDYVEHHANMIDILKTPGCPNSERVTLNPCINPVILGGIYRELASVLFSLYSIPQNKIGSLCQIDDFTWEVAGRPLSLHMNELVRLGTLPQMKLPTSTFSTASSYFEALAELQLSHLISQRNDAVLSEDDCRRKFVARFLFRKIIRNPTIRSQWILSENGPFPIWCDDFRPGNVLVDADLKIAGVVDWEFTYAAPMEFSHAPPWWLILEKPEYWSNGLEDWCKEYEERLHVFLEAMSDCEEMAPKKSPSTKQRLSDLMRHSWESGDFWIMYAARNNFAFDAIYWNKIDRRFFGATTTQCDNICDMWKERLNLLDLHEKELMDRYVGVKMTETETRVLAWDPDEYTLDYINKGAS